MSPDDSVREFLAARGCPEDVVAGGLDGLMAGWQRASEQVEAGYPLGLDDYLNDLDSRQLLEEAMVLAPPAERAAASARLGEADGRLRRHVRLVGECLWGARVAASEGWTAAANWWYFAVPLRPGPVLREDLGEPE
jgi:hypothetical protein